MTEHSDTPKPDPKPDTTAGSTPTTPPGAHTRKTLYQRGAILAVAVVAVVVGVVLIVGGGSSTDTASTDQLGAAGPQGVASPIAPAATDATPSAAPSAADACSVAATTDPAYTLSMQTTPNPPAAEGTLFKLAIANGGQPVTGAKVCMSADMTTMHHAGVENTASEKSAGHYELELKLPMRGPWAGNAIIVQPGKPAVSVPVSFNVG